MNKASTHPLISDLRDVLDKLDNADRSGELCGFSDDEIHVMLYAAVELALRKNVPHFSV